MSAPVFGAIDVLALGADWEQQSSSPTLASTRATATGSDGDVVAETTHNDVESGTVSYIYVGAETNFPAAFAADSCDVGDLCDTNTLLVTGWSIDYSPCATGKRPAVTFTYRDGPTSDPATPFVYVSALGAALPTYVSANVDVPDILSVTAGDAEIQTSSCDLAMNFDPDLDASGDYLAGQGYEGTETLNLQFVGTPTSITSTGWQQTAGPGTNGGEVASNTAYGTSAYTFVRGVTRT